MIRAASIPKNTFADIQITSLCLMRIFSVALKFLLSTDSCVLALVLKVLYSNSLLSIPLNRSFFSFLDNSFIVPAGVLTSLFAEQRSEEHTSELQSLMSISYAVFCLK